MQQNATESARADLPPQQTRALAALLEGATITAVADSAGVDRTTVHRWPRDDPDFQAAYNAVKRDLRREVQAGIERAVHRAIETVCAAIEEGDVRAALAILKGTGVLVGHSSDIGPEDPAEVEEEAKLAARARESDRLLRRAMII
jgi:AcrR family transcriptional regulator